MRALLSVANREGIAPFARDLLGLGIEVFATDGTRDSLAAENVEVRSVSELTGTEPMAGGQVKTSPSRDLRRHPRPARPARPARGAREARASA